MPWTAAIIAGGSATRLGGRDKSRLRVGGRTIFERQIMAIRPLTDRILVVANEPDRFRPAAFPVVSDLVPGAAALGGIYTALSSSATDYVLVVACDMPFLTTVFLRHLVATADGVDVAIPHGADGYQPMCACYSRACLEPIRRRIDGGALRVQDLLGDVRTREIGPDELARFDADGLLFLNVNTPEDHERAQRAAERAGLRPEAPDDRIMHVASRRQQDR